jgi:hypothetical protein
VEIISHYDTVAQMDVKTTLLNWDLKDEVYMRQPKGFIANSQNTCKINKSILGLYRSPVSSILFTRLFVTTRFFFFFFLIFILYKA